MKHNTEVISHKRQDFYHTTNSPEYGLFVAAEDARYTLNYTYDVWGKLLSVTNASGAAITDATHIANVNPIRYRGYFYDTETKLYYCNSRYYDPQIKRFINADELLSTGTGFLGYNMFAYCENNPVMYCDPSGAWLRYAIKKVYNKAKDFVESHIDLSAVGAWFLQMEKDEDDIYHASFDCWQQYFGYNYLYDRVFDTATSMESEKFPFEYDGETYTFWAWKGDYLNLGAGAEMGIYVGDSYHKSVDKSLAMLMQMELSYKGETIINYGPAERHWWITGFNPAVPEVNADDLFAVYRVDFNNTGMYYAFKNSFNGNYGNWLLFDSSTQAIFFFD